MLKALTSVPVTGIETICLSVQEKWKGMGADRAQATKKVNDQDVLAWVIDCHAVLPGTGRSGVISVTVASPTMPALSLYSPCEFESLEALAWTSNDRAGQGGMAFSASAVRSVNAPSHPTPKKEAAAQPA